jgi:site-specific DNA recombinase
VNPAGWTWQPTSEKFGEWWDLQDTEGRNVWLRSMGIRLTWENRNGAVSWQLETNFMERFEEHLRLGESADRVVRQPRGLDA